MKHLAKDKQRIFARTVQRRKYNSMADSHHGPSESAKEAMRRKPYGLGNKTETGKEQEE